MSKSVTPEILFSYSDISYWLIQHNTGIISGDQRKGTTETVFKKVIPGTLGLIQFIRIRTFINSIADKLIYHPLVIHLENGEV